MPGKQPDKAKEPEEVKEVSSAGITTTTTEITGLDGKKHFELSLNFILPKGKVSSLMGVMNYLQSKYEVLKLEINAMHGEIVELNKRVDEQQSETRKLWLHLSTLCDFAEWNRRDITATEREITILKKEIERLNVTILTTEKYFAKQIATLKEGEDCPDCDNSGNLHTPRVVCGGYVSCGWCHENPSSKFNKKRWKR